MRQAYGGRGRGRVEAGSKEHGITGESPARSPTSEGRGKRAIRRRLMLKARGRIRRGREETVLRGLGPPLLAGQRVRRRSRPISPKQPKQADALLMTQVSMPSGLKV